MNERTLSDLPTMKKQVSMKRDVSHDNVKTFIQRCRCPDGPAPLPACKHTTNKVPVRGQREETLREPVAAVKEQRANAAVTFPSRQQNSSTDVQELELRSTDTVTVWYLPKQKLCTSYKNQWKAKTVILFLYMLLHKQLKHLSLSPDVSA